MRTGLRAFLLLLPALAIPACALPYYTQAFGGQMSLLRQRVAIDEVIRDDDTAEATRDRLRLVQELRRFAVVRIGLPGNDSYRSYVELGRDFVVWNVVAADEFSVDPLTWCFPVAGCVAYRGYFDRERAGKYRAKLDARGFDTFLGGAVAYSTLGYFDDPVLDTMLARGDIELAATLFHELAHQRFYVRDDTELSESFATAVERYAVETWLEERGAATELSAYRRHLDRELEFSTLVGRQRSLMRELYAADLATEERRAAKAAAFEAMANDYAALRESWGGDAVFDGWFVGGFNNAKLAALTSYRRWVPGLLDRLRSLGPGAFYLEFGALLELPPDRRAVQLDAWNAASETVALTDP